MKDNKEDNLIGIAVQLYNAAHYTATGKKLTSGMDKTVKRCVEAALSLKEAEPDLFYGLAAIVLAEAKDKLKLGEDGRKYANRLIQYCLNNSAYMQEDLQE